MIDEYKNNYLKMLGVDELPKGLEKRHEELNICLSRVDAKISIQGMAYTASEFISKRQNRTFEVKGEKEKKKDKGVVGVKSDIKYRKGYTCLLENGKCGTIVDGRYSMHDGSIKIELDGEEQLVPREQIVNTEENDG